VFAVLVATAIGAAGGYWFARPPAAVPTSPASAATSQASTPADERSILYYRDPSGAPLWSATPKSNPDGRAYLPVYDDQEPSFAKAEAKPASAGSGAKKILYYRNPMGLPDTSQTPKKDSMGMDYIPVYEGEDQDDGTTIKVSLDRIQRSGVRTEEARLRTLTRSIRAAGTARGDERKLTVVTLRAEGYIEALHVSATGEAVKAGQPLFRLYSAPLVQAQLEYALALKMARAGRDSEQSALIDGAAQKLRNLGVPESRMREIQQSGAVPRTIEWPAPSDGTVIEKKVVNGQRVMPGEELYRIIDLSTLWVIAEVTEQDVALVTPGSPATVTFRAFASEPIEGQVTFIYPDLKPETRTARVRIEIPNPGGRLKTDMYADVVVHAGADERPVVAVPDSAVIDSGTRQLVLIAKDEGRFEPRPVKLGRRGEGYVEVSDGVKEGEKVVTSATFLIDAESNLRAALRAFTQAEAPK
jgi:membrane fusion protein, copper/silver efflux system